MDIMQALFPDIDPEGTEPSSLQANNPAYKNKESLFDIVTSRAKKTELRLRNMKKDLAGEINPTKRQRLRDSIAEYEIRLDELNRILSAAEK